MRGMSAGLQVMRISRWRAGAPVRLTAVLYQEDGDWKLVQSHHASIGVPNEQMLRPMFQGTG